MMQCRGASRSELHRVAQACQGILVSQLVLIKPHQSGSSSVRDHERQVWRVARTHLGLYALRVVRIVTRTHGYLRVSQGSRVLAFGCGQAGCRFVASLAASIRDC